MEADPKGDVSLLTQWYKDGLRFKCTGCGGCCTGGPGFVWLTDEDIDTLSRKLGLTREAFIRRHTRDVGGRLSLLEHPNYDCIFLEGKSCTVYEARPKQCRTFPFWPMIMKSEKEWQRASKTCEGIDHPDAEPMTCDEIDKLLD